MIKISQKIQVSEKFKGLYGNSRYKVPYGGRGSGKTTEVAQYIILRVLTDPFQNAQYYCCRETQTSLKDSVKPALESLIYQLGLSKCFYTSPTSSEIRCLYNNNRIIFSGLSHIKQVKQIKSATNVVLLWVEEADKLSEEAFDILTPCVRGITSLDEEERKRYAKLNYPIILTFNPDKKEDFVYRHFVEEEPPPNSWVQKVNWCDNPFWNNIIDEERVACLKYPAKYRRIWDGEPGSTEFQVFKEEWWCYYDNLKNVIPLLNGLFITADTAYKTKNVHDYSVIQCWGYEENRRLYLIDQVRGKWMFPELIAAMKDFTMRQCRYNRCLRPQRIYIEDKASGASLVQTLAREGFNSIAWKPKDYLYPQSKVGRAKEASLFVERNLLYLPKNAVWIKKFVNELTDFSEDESHEFDDQVDGLTMATSVWRSKGGGK